MSLHDELKEAENEYIQSQRDIADEQRKQAEEKLDVETPMNEAVDETLEQRENQKALDNAQNFGAGYQQKAQLTDVRNDAEIQKQNELFQTKIAERDAKMQSALAAKQLASDRAKLKYQLAQQRLQQAQTNVSNICKVLNTLGCALPFPWNMMAGFTTAIAGGTVSQVI